jgi:hypothetical protein
MKSSARIALFCSPTCPRVATARRALLFAPVLRPSQTFTPEQLRLRASDFALSLFERMFHPDIVAQSSLRRSRSATIIHAALFTATSELLWLTDARIADNHSFIEHALTGRWGETAILFAHVIVRTALLDMTGVEAHCCRRAGPRLEAQVDARHSFDIGQATASIAVVAKGGRTIARITDRQFVNAKSWLSTSPMDRHACSGCVSQIR